MNTNELREKNINDLKSLVLELQREQLNLRMQRGMGEMARTHQFKKVRRDIARIKTILNEKEREHE